MHWRLIALAVRMSLAELRRSRLTIALFLLVPSVFFALVVSTAGDRTISFALPGIGANTVVAVSEKNESVVFVGEAAVGFMAAFFAHNLLRKRREFDRRLVFCGYHASEHMIAKLSIVCLMILLVSTFTAFLFSFVFSARHVLAMFAGLLLVGLLYAGFGLLISAFVRGELEGLLLVIMLANVDLGWLQNPLYYTGASNSTIIHLLPGYFPTQVAMAGSFTDFSTMAPLFFGLGYGALLCVIALAVYWRSIRLRLEPRGKIKSHARKSIQKLFYAATFIVIVPALLTVWAVRSGTNIAIPIPLCPELGLAFVLVGCAFMLSSMLALWRYGNGLPMNAFPPERFVRRGPYALFSHPIYIGFVAVVAGTAVFSQSSSGFWLVFPTTLACVVALLEGYEINAIRTLFGTALVPPFFRIPARKQLPKTIADACSAVLFLLAPFVAICEIGNPTPHEHWLAGVSSLLIILRCSFDKSQNNARRTIQEGWTLFGLNLLAAFVVLDPSILIVSTAFWIATSQSTIPLRALAMAVFIAAILLLPLPGASLAVGMLIGTIASQSVPIWRSTVRGAEWFANSWHEWRFGRARIINHGAYPGLGIAIGLLIMFSVAEPNDRVLFVAFSLICIIGAGLWGQLLEGSSKLSRPYGYYGGTFAVLVLSPFSMFAGLDPWHLLAGIGLAGPWIQAFGRIRCLVQGCCHGAPTDGEHGILYTHPNSRVIRISKLGNTPLLPTQLYSIVWNVASGIMIAGLWLHGCAYSLIVGMYFILNGIGRFVEESRRGETQTKTVARLRVYQWLAVLTVIIGMVLSSFASAPAQPPIALGWADVAMATGFGLFTWFVYGVDFPESKKRFARLA